MTLYSLLDGQTAKIVFLNNHLKTKNKLLRLGVVEGVRVKVVRKAIFNGPIQIKVRDFCLAIRKCDADKIIVRYDWNCFNRKPKLWQNNTF